MKTVPIKFIFAFLNLILLSLFFRTAHAMPLIFTSVPAVPQIVTVNGEKTLQYTIRNNTKSTLWPISFSNTVKAGSMQAIDGCDAALPGYQSCTESFLFTAPRTAQTVTGSVMVSYGGRYQLSDNTLTIDVDKPAISVVEPSLMFVNRSFGRSSIYYGTLKISNIGAVPVKNIKANIINNAGSIITQSPAGCAALLGVNAACQIEFSSAMPIDVHASISIGGDDSNIVTISPAAISVVALAPPTDKNYGLGLVAGCTDASNDAGLFQVTNNTNTQVSNIQASSAIEGVQTPNQDYAPGHNIYCNGNTLARNQYCEIRVLSGTAVAGKTGVVSFSGNGTQSVAVKAEIESPASTFPYEFNTSGSGGTIFVANNACNLVEVVTSSNAPLGLNPTWSASNNYCARTIEDYSDWRLPDLGETAGSSDSVLSGEWNVLYNSGDTLAELTISPVVNYWGPSIDASHAWSISPYSNIQTQSLASAFNTKARCIRAFTI
ncbi:MAG: hypothetical protein NTZ67_05000 [Gammaproteobacteria bacterium]|nr:hypothetical protein [Gammaproteobacteria bacterium]